VKVRPTAEKSGDRHVAELAEDVPQSDIDALETDTCHRNVSKHASEGEGEISRTRNKTQGNARE
jgi:hypothetical protein